MYLIYQLYKESKTELHVKNYQGFHLLKGLLRQICNGHLYRESEENH